MIDLDKVYDPASVEGEIYALWERSGAFRSEPKGKRDERTYTIVIPPPNVTGALHLGHALNNTLQDILIRYHRMRGFNTLWQPGTDHAGIATQAVVERRIREQDGKSRHELGREELVRRIWSWKDEYEKRILGQLKLMGCSCDWGYRRREDGTYECDWHRTRFTLDDGLARAVRHMFFMLFRDGLIFRGKRLVNWDTELQTAVADDEIYYETVPGKFWHIRYPVMAPRPGEPEFVVIATTRPETMLGDTAVAVNPDPGGAMDRLEQKLRADLVSAPVREQPEIERRLQSIAERRSSHLGMLESLARMAREGRSVRLPLMEREIPLIADDWADPILGSGCVKITPAHDPNDYEVGLRHKLPMINVLTPDGKVARIVESNGAVNPRSARYEGLEFTSDGRDRVVADLEALGLIENIEDREREVGHSDRSKTPIEPFLSDQWFVRTKGTKGTWGERHEGTEDEHHGLAQMAMDAVLDGRIRVYPERYAKTYLDWLGEKRDWCISRQLWWGHRIPVWVGRWSPDFVETDQSHLEISELHGEWHEWRPSAGVGTEDQLVFRACRGEVTQEDRVALADAGFVEEESVLDTWFSSALWPFSTLGWPEATDHLKQYYPGSVLVTSRDIITNWVARMVMFGLHAMDEVPFDRVYITPKVLDGRGETMSKSKGNGVDPVDIIHMYGADALRYSMADMTTETQDIRMPVEYLCPHCGKLTDQSLILKTEEQARKSRGEKLERRLQPADCKRAKCSHRECGREFATQWAGAADKEQLGLAREVSEKFEVGRNFCNKLWNAARFAFRNLKDAPCEPLSLRDLPPEDRWILARLSQTIRRVHGFLDRYQYSAMVRELREFFWDNLCDWYIELTKPRMGDAPTDGDEAREWPAASNADRDSCRQVLAFCVDQVLRLWHPIIPFITERLWQQLNSLVPRRGLPGTVELEVGSDLVIAAYPPEQGYPALDDEGILMTFAQLQEASRAVRDLRTRAGVSPKEKVNVTAAVSAEYIDAFRAHAHILRTTAWIDRLTIAMDVVRPANSAAAALHGLRVYVHDISDDAAEGKRAAATLADVEKQIAAKQSKLDNTAFVANARPEVVAAEKDRLAQLLEQQRTLKSYLSELVS